MYSNFLVATDGSKLADAVVIHATDLARRLGARITAFHAAAEYPEPIYTEGMMVELVSREAYESSAQASSRKLLARVEKKAAAAGVPCVTHSVLSSTAWESILAAAKKHKCDAIVMGSHGRGGLAALLIGSTTQKVLTHTRLPVIVVRCLNPSRRS